MLKFVRKKKIPVVEDNCEAVGAKFKKSFLGTIGDVGILSFDHGKNITTGEGGAILTNNKKMFNYAKEYHDHGHQLNPKFPRGMDTVKIQGFNHRMTELQAAVGLAQIKKLQFILNENKKRYLVLKQILEKKFKIRKNYKFSFPSYDTFVFKVKNKKKRDKIVKILKQSGIGTKNLPDALKWHFASYWKHLISKHEIKNINRSLNLIKEHIAIPIQIKKNSSNYSLVAKKINSI